MALTFTEIRCLSLAGVEGLRTWLGRWCWLIWDWLSKVQTQECWCKKMGTWDCNVLTCYTVIPTFVIKTAILWSNLAVYISSIDEVKFIFCWLTWGFFSPFFQFHIYPVLVLKNTILQQTKWRNFCVSLWIAYWLILMLVCTIY